MTVEVPKYKEISKKKIAERDAKFIEEWLIPSEKLPSSDLKDVSQWIPKSGYLSEAELEITESNCVEILENIKNKKWTALQVTKAFCHRASIAHQLVNCLSEVFFEDAFKQAEDLDKYQLETGKVMGPLHGLPISLKDNFNIKGQPTSIGIVNFTYNPKEMDEDSVLVKLFRDSGAVFYVKTNVPVAMMMPESTNHIFGNTSNPLNRELSAGGSSGGEAALLALKGSPIGVGSDIGGSIRIPASFQNLWAIRPSFGRFPTYGARSGLPGLESVNSVNGPLTTSLDSLHHYCKTVVDLQPWLSDPKVIEIPWRPVELPSKLNVAVVIDDGWVRPTPPIIRGMEKTIKSLKDAGHTIIDWNPSEHLRLSQIISSFFVSDGGVHIRKETDATGETLFPYMENYGTTPEMGVAELWKLQAERTSLIKKFLDRWNSTAEETGNGKPIDCIILPATPFPGNPNGKFHDYVGYTSPFNLLDYSVGIFPVTRADKELDKKEERESFYSKTDENVWKDYDPVESHGGAVALQLVGRKHQEEKVLSMLQVVKDALEN